MVLYTAQTVRSWMQQYILGDTVKQELLHYCTGLILTLTLFPAAFLFPLWPFRRPDIKDINEFLQKVPMS